MGLVILLAALIAVLVVEASCWGLKRSGLADRLKMLTDRLNEFRRAKTDRARQEILISTGLATLRVSLLTMAACGGLLALVLLPSLLMHWTSAQINVYLLTTTVCATFWWLIRIRRRSTSTSL